MKKLIRQIRSFGSLRKEHGVHVSIIMRKPEVSSKAPTYIIGGSNCSFARQGGFISVMSITLLITRHLLATIRRAFIMEIMFLRGNINKIKRFDYRLGFKSLRINLDQEVYCWYSLPSAS